jgi:HEAT repeat protein
MPSFKSDEEFLTYISMGASGVKRVMDDLTAQGRTPLLLERGSNDYKLWKISRIKGFRVPDILCADTGRRVESRAKTNFEISGSHSTSNPERAWDFGLADTDYIAIPVCERCGEHPIDWRACDLIQYVLIGDMRTAHKAGQTTLTDPKAASQGSEVRLIWPSCVATSPGTVVLISTDRIQYRSKDSGRVVTLRLEKGGKKLTPLVAVGQSVERCHVLASVVPVYQTVADDPKVNHKHYLSDLQSLWPSVRFAAAKALGLFRNKTVEAALLKHLQNGSEHIFVRLETAASLARSGNRDGWKFLEDTLKDQFAQHRLEAVIVLAEIHFAEARDLLFRVLNDSTEEAEIRAGAAWALGEHRDRSVLPALVQVFADTSLSVRIEAARALVKLAPAARADIVKAFGGSDDAKRPGIAWTLSRIGGASVAELLPLMKSEDVRQWVAYVIGTHDPGVYVGEIEELRKRDPEVYFAVTVLWKILTSWVFGLKEYG